jgi:hypothetical protein
MASFLAVRHMTYRTILEELLDRKEDAFENLLRIEDITQLPLWRFLIPVAHSVYTSST